MRLLDLQKQNRNKIIAETLKTLKKGGLVVFPSDTVYGLLVDATNEKAVQKLIEFKQRPKGKPISVFVTNIQMIDALCKVDSRRRNILKNILPGPFTIVLDYKKTKSVFKISNQLLSEIKTLGVRYPDFEFIQLLVSKFKKPITATSANLSGSKPVYSIQSLFKQISIKKKELLDLVIDIGKLPYNKPSTVIDLTTDKIRQLREGDVVFSRGKSLTSKTPEETKNIAKQLLKENIAKVNLKPLVFILKGPLGAGKTIFAKGLGEFLGIEGITSPTYVVYDEYRVLTQKSKIKSQNIKFKNQKFIHGDLYNVSDEEELENINLERYLKPGNIICVEWGDKSFNLINKFIEKGNALYIEMDYLGKTKRKIIVNSISNNK
ncbi:MAG: L-threonylcarbamoyladenylate synthase [Patescibacteria group bacterium]